MIINGKKTSEPCFFCEKPRLWMWVVSVQKTSVKTEKECLDYLSWVNAPRLSPEVKGLCEGKLSLQECWDALSSLKNGKIPGNDGLTKEFYIAFFGERITSS